ncbi:hypothetical protein AB0K27_02120 [Micromonospora echinospora]|uniref:SUKH superfamily protein n=1 Tax=Micromonospora echinospora TaxID=1877 RepID=A0ABR6MAP1_MICEC|nr:hypothetical protein [Micromonospora echinospora]MBB5112144.1 hypothetical protein [Micromonospora echinospora]
MTEFQELLAAVPPPAGRSSRFDQWDELDRRLGFAVPQDYRLVIDAYGPGCFDGYLHVLQPKSPFEPIRLGSFGAQYRERIRAQIETGRVIPHAPDRLQPVARTEDGDVVSWVVASAGESDSWSLAINNSSRSEWLSFEGGIASFLHAVFVGGLRLPFFPEGFPSSSPVFETYPSVEEVRSLVQ